MAGVALHGIDVSHGRAAAACVRAEGLRVTVLTETLLRIEFAPDGRFEDRPSLFAVRRNLPVPKFETTRRDGWLTVETARLRLRWRMGAVGLTPRSLSVAIKDSSAGSGAGEVVWRPGASQRGNLGGAVRTLDEARGPVRLADGLVSRDGWFVLDDTATPVLTADWIEPRTGLGRRDWYFFGYGLDYARVLADLAAVGGAIPLPPRWVFGSWYSRYWPYTGEDYRALVASYEAHGFPLGVVLLDMDWHLPGWTGYTWNRDLIGDPERLLRFFHSRGIAVGLNLHPADGVHPHEAAYARFAEVMGVDADAGRPVPFDCADRVFMEHYFRVLHHPLEAQGVDFWWLDWQQETTSKLARVDPLRWLNQLHTVDRSREPGRKRAMILSRWGGWGGHRCPVQFSGDAESSWSVLAFQVRMTAAGGNAGCAYWSHDIGGHWSLSGRCDPELYVRWLQFGAVSPVMRVHSTRDADSDRRPWLDGEPYTKAARRAYRWRERLGAYLYTAARRCHDTGVPLCRPMYLAYPEHPQAFHAPGQFMLGDDLLAAPIVAPGRGRARLGAVHVWLPPGVWFDLETKCVYAGPGEAVIQAPLHKTVLLARGGRPIPMLSPDWEDAVSNEAVLPVLVCPGSSGCGVLYEDDGTSRAYEDGACAWLPLSYYDDLDGHRVVVVGPMEGAYDGLLAVRDVFVQFVWLDHGQDCLPHRVFVRSSAVVGGDPSEVGCLDDLIGGDARPFTGRTQVRSYANHLLGGVVLSEVSLDQQTILVVPCGEGPAEASRAMGLCREAVDIGLAMQQLERGSEVRGALDEALDERLFCLLQLRPRSPVPADVRLDPLPRLAECVLRGGSEAEREAACALAGLHLGVRVVPGGGDGFVRVVVVCHGRGNLAWDTADVRLTVRPRDEQDGAARLMGDGEVLVDGAGEGGAVVASEGPIVVAPDGVAWGDAPADGVWQGAGRALRWCFEVPIEPDLLRAYVGRVFAEVDWEGTRLRVEEAVFVERRFMDQWWIVGPFTEAEEGATAGPGDVGARGAAEPAGLADRGSTGARDVWMEAVDRVLRGDGPCRSWRGVDGFVYTFQPYRSLAASSDAIEVVLNHAVNMRAVFGARRCRGLAFTELLSECGADVRLGIRHDGPLTLYVNGEAVYGHSEVRPLYDPPVEVAARFRRGVNRVVVVQSQEAGGWGFEMRVLDAGRAEVRQATTFPVAGDR